MSNILAYTDRISAYAGDNVAVKASCRDIQHYRAALIRIIHGDINPEGPGYQEEVIDPDVGGPFAARYQPIYTGSYGVIESPPLYHTHQALSIQMLIWPTLPAQGEQTLLSQWNPVTNDGFRLYLDSQGSLAFEIALAGRAQLQVTTGRALVAQRWYLASACYDAEHKQVTIAQQPAKEYPVTGDAVKINQQLSQPVVATEISGSILIAARLAENHRATEHFNGRIEAPAIHSRILTDSEMTTFSTPDPTAAVASWDFSQGIDTDTIHDVSGNGFHGRLVNLPTRGVSGHAWDGEEHCWKKKPDHYAAIHFHDDDLYDCDWSTDFHFRVPDDLPSGVYAIRLSGGDEEYYLPIAVRPPQGTTTAPVAFLLPTASYMAYANNRIGIDVPETEIVCGRLLQMSPVDLFMQEHPELGLCFYDVHNDGSGVYYSSRLRPVVNMQPKHIGHLGGFGSNVWQFNADTHILAWLENLQQSFDVITDEDLHNEGVTLLNGYQAVITGTHPEYYSLNMMQSLQGYLDHGGRLMYLGGNGFYWRISFHDAMPGVIECRKSEDGIRAFAPLPGEFYASFTGEYTGLWRRNGIAPNTVAGIGMVSQGFDYSAPYTLTPDSENPRVEFIFKGVSNSVIGDYGLCGGGAAGLELDATDHNLGTPPNTLVLAVSERYSDLYLMTPEDMNDPAPGLGGSEAEVIRAEMVFYETPSDGAVFSTGSIAWGGSLSHNNYQNDISRITANVLKRFIDQAPFSEDTTIATKQVSD